MRQINCGGEVYRNPPWSASGFRRLAKHAVDSGIDSATKELLGLRVRAWMIVKLGKRP